MAIGDGFGRRRRLAVATVPTVESTGRRPRESRPIRYRVSIRGVRCAIARRVALLACCRRRMRSAWLPPLCKVQTPLEVAVGGIAMVVAARLADAEY
ncbi:hypothetical protein E2562_028072 [Oryza meyeriana var. granulata]|uniref:Uncharacterized protein n=1 Tax=Oryza meyeriana var. granulata TaxID=110450 RepID=A0A6G1BZ88_9ORYZ|nr:hypothetical protein E2562_028072 [Oryza meyeriana var. granulata]